jgi:hypothetical protein
MPLAFCLRQSGTFIAYGVAFFALRAKNATPKMLSTMLPQAKNYMMKSAELKRALHFQRP